MIKRTVLFSFVISSWLYSEPSLLILDSDGKSSYHYRSLQELAHSVGFQPSIKSLYQFLENPQIDSYDMVFFFISPYMLNTNHPLSQYYIQIIREYMQMPHKICGILLPSHMRYSESLQKKFDTFFMQLLPSENPQILHDCITYLLKKSDSLLGTVFGTTLLNKSTVQVPSFFTQSTGIHLIPVDNHAISEQTKSVLPLGFLLQDQKNNSTLFISKDSFFNFADIDENFWIMPFKLHQRNEFLSVAQDYLYALHKQLKPSAEIKKPLPTYFADNTNQQKKITAESYINKALNKKYAWIHKHGISCAWLDPFDFFAHEDALKKMTPGTALKNGLAFLYNANFNLLWFEFIPEWYLSSNGLKKQEKTKYIQQIRQLALHLKYFFMLKGKPLPKIFVGMNLTSNFKTAPVIHPVKNIFGNVYDKIPSPVDVEHFWKPEVLDVFDAFYKTFHTILPIDGVFFDFEMYHAQNQAGTYTDLMDFSDLAWNIYSTSDENAHGITTHEDRISYLQKYKKFPAYFDALENEAARIGTMIKQQMRQHNKDLLFAAYAPTLPSSWFYRGIMRGLSSATEPLMLATFNTDYYSHHDWLVNHNIHLLHGSVLMLSKLKESPDFNLIQYIKNHHYFIWYNRPSRMNYGYTQEELNKVWWGIEASALSAEEIAKGLTL